MRTICETIDDEIFVDLILEPHDEEKLHDRSIEPIRIYINGLFLNLWVRTATARELYGEQDWIDDE
jgi:hypothetical protein